MLQVLQYRGKELVSVRTIKGCIADVYASIKDTQTHAMVKQGDRLVAEWYWHSMYNEWTLKIY